MCQNCGADAPVGDDKEQAIDKWNRRAASVEEAEMLERIQSLERELYLHSLAEWIANEYDEIGISGIAARLGAKWDSTIGQWVPSDIS